MSHRLNINEALKLGIKAHKAGKFQEANKYYTAILKAKPKHPDANHNAGVLAAGFGKVHEALPFFKIALNANPTTPQFWLSYIDALIKLNKIDNAKAALGEARKSGVKGDHLSVLEQQFSKQNENKQSPSQDQLQFLVNLYSERKFDLVLDGAKKLLESFPRSIDLYNLCGVSNAENKQFDLAVQCYHCAISIDPNYADAHNNMGIALREQGNVEKAIESFNEALKIRSNYAEAYYNLSVALQEIGRLEESIEACNKALAVKQDYFEVYNALGNALQEQGKLEGAVAAYQNALLINGDYSVASYNLAVLFYQNSQFQSAIPIFKKDGSMRSQIRLLKCFYELDDRTNFYRQLDYLINLGETNAVIGSHISRSQIKYGINRANPYCNKPLKYLLHTHLTDRCQFEDIFIKGANQILSDGTIQNKSQRLLTNGLQTVGNIFSKSGEFTKRIESVIRSEIKNYRMHFKSSKEGLIRDWPANYEIYGWIVSMKSGGVLAPHMHDNGWISGSIYINVPPKLKEDSGNLVVCLDEGEVKSSLSIDVVTGSLCLFPSSLLHYTEPFESAESRVVLAFDIIPKYLT